MDMRGLLGISACLVLLLPIQAASAANPLSASAGPIRRQLLGAPGQVGRFQYIGTAPIAGAHTYQFQGTNKFLILDFMIPAGKQPYPPSNPGGRWNLQVWNRGTNQWTTLNTWNNWVCGGWAPLGDGGVVMFAAHVPYKAYQGDQKAIATVHSTDRNVVGNRNFKLSYNRWYASGFRLGTGQTYVIGGTLCAGCWAARGAQSPGADLLGVNPERQAPRALPVNRYMVYSGSNNYYVHGFVLPTGKLAIMNSKFIQVMDPFSGIELARTAPLPGAAADLDWQYPFMGSPAILRTAPLLPGKDNKVRFIAFGGNWPRRRPTIVTDCANLAVSVDLLVGANGAVRFGPWLVERMPGPRCVHNTVVLPNGNVMILGGAERGFGGGDKLPLEAATGGLDYKNRSLCNEPTTTPWVYDPIQLPGRRFRVLDIASRIPRLYHNTALLTSAGDILITGGTYVDDYISRRRQDFDTTPTGQSEFRVETYSPPELFRARPIVVTGPPTVGFNKIFPIRYKGAVKTVVIVQQGTNTHGVTMGNRVQALRYGVKGGVLQVQAPANGNYAPPGFYLLFLVAPGGSYSRGHWIQFGTTVRNTAAPQQYTGPWFTPKNQGVTTQSADGYVLDVAGATAGSKLVVRKSTGDASQKWTLDANQRLVHSDSKLCAESVDGAKAAPGSLVVLSPCSDKLKQKWLPSQARGEGQLAPASSARICLEIITELKPAGDAVVKLGECRESIDQKWDVLV